MSQALTYPLNIDPSADYVIFQHFQYQLNADVKKYGSNPPSDGKTIKLYMPNTTPGSFQDQEIKEDTYPGRFGQMQKSMLATLGNGGGAMRDQLSRMGVPDNLLPGEGNRGNFNGDTGFRFGPGMGEASGQFMLDQTARSIFGRDAATAIALGQGQVYNPNAELIYRQPLHRKFPFSFDFMPRSAAEASVVDKILLEFKKYSAPELAGEGNFMRIPDLWTVKYVQGGKDKFNRMTKFKACFLKNFNMQDNPAQKYHMTIDDPAGAVPVHTSIAMVFVETQPIVRQDHEDAVGQGYYRGM